MSSDYRWVCACIDGIGLVVAQVKDDSEWDPEQEQGAREFRRLTSLTVGPEQFHLEKLVIAATFQGAKISVRPWAVSWMAVPMPQVVEKANELWSDVQVAKPSQVPEYGGPRARGRR